MNSDLLADLTPSATGSVEPLLAAARQRARRRRKAGEFLTAAAIVTASTAGLLLLFAREAPTAAVSTTQTPVLLSREELLDSFGDQPVALVTWPDGRQQLLAIAAPSAAPTQRQGR